MENVLADDSMLELQIDQSSIDSLENGSWWARFIGIVSIIALALALIGVSFFMNVIMSRLEILFGISGVTAMIWTLVAISIIIAGAVIALLMNFAVKTNKGVKELDQEKLEKGISSLKVYFIIAGIFAILGAIFSLIGLFSAGAASSF